MSTFPLYEAFRRSGFQWVVGDKEQWIYVIHNPLNQTYKIGYASCFGSRFEQIRTMSGIELQLVVAALPNMYEFSTKLLERLLHNFFSEKRTIGEWFKLTIDDIAQIVTLLFSIDCVDYEDNSHMLFKDTIFGDLIELYNAPYINYPIWEYSEDDILFERFNDVTFFDIGCTPDIQRSTYVQVSVDKVNNTTERTTAL